MQWKQSAEDFHVTEISRLKPKHGDFALYQLSKQEIGTHEALAQISRAMSVPAFRIDHGGLKDRVAQTSQYITIHNGPMQSFDHSQWQMNYLGQCDRKMQACEIEANEFTLVIRDLEHIEDSQLQRSLEFLKTVGLPNYFDQQRFGSVTDSKDFVAVPWMKKDYERALKLALAVPNSRDAQDEALQRKILHAHWGDWDHCKYVLEKSNRRSVVTYLCDHPAGFKKAFALVSPEMRGLYLSAFQSHIWNQVIAHRVRMLSEAQAELKSYPVSLPVLCVGASNPGWTEEILQLPSGRMRLSESNPLRQEIETVLMQWEIALPLMRVSFPRDVYYASAKRKIWLTVDSVEANCQPDDVFPGRTKVTLTFRLPSGSYATLVLKQLSLLWNQPLGDSAAPHEQ